MNLAHARLVAAALTVFGITTPSMANKSLLYIASQDPQKMGIALAEFDSETGALSAPRLIAETSTPAHFEITRDGTHLYMCNSGTPGGVSAFEVDRKTGALKFLNYKESKGRGPSYVSVDGTGRYVLDANYGGGYVEVLSLAKDGSLDAQTAFVEHTGSSVHPQRQTKPYAHWFRTDPSNRFALAADLGTDEIVVYRFDETTGKLTFGDGAKAKVPPGMGPRHIVFHPNGKWVYVIAEMGNEVMAFNWDGGKGSLSQFQSVKTLAGISAARTRRQRSRSTPMGNFSTPRIAVRIASSSTRSTRSRASFRSGSAFPRVAGHRGISRSTKLTNGSS
jgi:6-phosphogluconolactonase